MKPDLVLRLSRIQQLPSVSPVAAKALEMIELPNVTAGQLGAIIEQDQTLAARLLQVANSPFYGFPRQISTIELAIVLLGFDTIKEIILTFLIQRFVSRFSSSLLDTYQFWQYSVFCGAAARVFARHLGYRVAGEAFVTALMHDIGILLLISASPAEYQRVRSLQKIRLLPLPDAEFAVFETTHAEVGGWLAQRWNLPETLATAIEQHHHYPRPIELPPVIAPNQIAPQLDQPLTVITALAEWAAAKLNRKQWAAEVRYPALYIPDPLLTVLDLEHQLTTEESTLRQEIQQEYEKALAFLHT